MSQFLICVMIQYYMKYFVSCALCSYLHLPKTGSVLSLVVLLHIAAFHKIYWIHI